MPIQTGREAHPNLVGVTMPRHAPDRAAKITARRDKNEGREFPINSMAHILPSPLDAQRRRGSWRGIPGAGGVEESPFCSPFPKTARGSGLPLPLSLDGRVHPLFPLSLDG